MIVARQHSLHSSTATMRLRLLQNFQHCLNFHRINLNRCLCLLQNFQHQFWVTLLNVMLFHLQVMQHVMHHLINTTSPQQHLMLLLDHVVLLNLVYIGTGMSPTK